MMPHVQRQALFAGVPVATPAATERPLTPRMPPDAAKLRRQMQMAIESLLAALDAIDGDSDFEDGADAEPACEDEGAACEDEGVDIGDDEPWLGRSETGWGAAQGSLGVHDGILDGEVLLSPVEAF